jgi:hypothetical protein
MAFAPAAEFEEETASHATWRVHERRGCDARLEPLARAINYRGGAETVSAVPRPCRPCSDRPGS